MPLTRRSVLRAGALAPVALSFPGAPLRAGTSPNDEIRVAVIGFRGRGRSHIKGLHALPGVRVTALCDVDSKVLAKEAAAFAKRNEEVTQHTDFREVLDRDDVDAIAVATPNHTHALIAVLACQAGKDVYLEKPVSHNVWEGRQIVRAARKHDRIVQTGTQARSSHALAEAIEWLQAGNLGPIEVARCLNYKPRKSIGKVDGAQTVPAHIDYDLWCGPVAKDPLRRKNLHYDWHWVQSTGNGDLGNQGIHYVDICRWALGESALAPRVFSVGGRVGYDDDGDTANTQVVVQEYESAPLVIEVRGLPRNRAEQDGKWRMDQHRGVGIGAIIHCEGGELAIPSYSRAIAKDAAGEVIEEWKGAKNHFENFIDAVRARKAETLTADIVEGHISSALCHTGNISQALGEPASRDEVREAIGDHPAAQETWARMEKHLEANAIDIGASDFRVGPWLELDPSTEMFRDARANALLRRADRAPFAVPGIE